jgi:endo-1,4-beta-xylanase
MKIKWIVLSLFLVIFIFQSKNIVSFVATEYAVYKIKELDTNSDGFINKEEWPGLGFSLLDFNGDSIATDNELRAFIKEYSKEFSWQNSVNERFELPDQLKRGSFISDSMQIPVGYYIYIPDLYYQETQKNFRTVYYLHGGRPGNEARSVLISNFIHKLQKNESSGSALYVFVNGGELSHYNSEELDSFGEDVFIQELIPHIDQTYRTVSNKSGRGLEGFSQGGRGATRYMFKYPELFGTVAAGGGSYMIEKLIQDNAGFEDDPRGAKSDVYYVGEGNDAWSLAKKHKESKKVTPKLLLWSGSEDPNLPSIEEYKNYLDKLNINYDFLIAEGVDHNPMLFYEKLGERLMFFHQGDRDNAD